MIQDFENYLKKYDKEIKELFCSVYSIAGEVYQGLEEKMWAGLPSLYKSKVFIRIIAFKDHINIEAKGIQEVEDKFVGYKLTPKKMLQLYIGDSIPEEALREAFDITLNS